MVKRKTTTLPDSHHDDNDAPKRPNYAKKPRGAKFRKSTKTVASDVDDAGSSSEDAELAKKTDAASPEAGPSDAVLRVNQDGEKYLDLGNRRRATVRNFKGHVYLDIRKFFLDGDIEKPGQKGIMLSQDQWEAMKKGADTIDELFANVKK